MIEKLLLKSGNTEPMRKVLELIQRVKETKSTVNVAEVGIGWGATAVEIIKALEEKDTYYFFDFEDNVNELYEDLCSINENHVNMIGIGNSTKKYDSYSWNLAKLYLQWKEERESAQRLDVVYLDGAHTFLFDSSAACILKEMIAVGGYIILDDLNWSIMDSPTCNPKNNPDIKNYYTDEQISTCQIDMVKKCFFDSDERFRIFEGYNRIAVFQRIR